MILGLWWITVFAVYSPKCNKGKHSSKSPVPQWIQFISVIREHFLLDDPGCKALTDQLLPIPREKSGSRSAGPDGGSNPTPQHPSLASICSIYSTSGGFKCRELPIDRLWNRIQIQPAGAVSWGSRVLFSEVILQTSAAGSNYARTTQCLAVFGGRNSQHKPFYSSLCVRHKGQGDALVPPSFVTDCVWNSQENKLPHVFLVLMG